MFSFLVHDEWKQQDLFCCLLRLRKTLEIRVGGVPSSSVREAPNEQGRAGLGLAGQTHAGIQRWLFGPLVTEVRANSVDASLQCLPTARPSDLIWAPALSLQVEVREL